MFVRTTRQQLDMWRFRCKAVGDMGTRVSERKGVGTPADIEVHNGADLRKTRKMKILTRSVHISCASIGKPRLTDCTEQAESLRKGT